MLLYGEKQVTDRALGAFEVEHFDGTASTGDTFEFLIDDGSDGEAPAFSRQGGSLYISTARGLKGATGAVTAISLEAAAAFCVYCVWQLWHLFR